jgi:hypothetical protein
LRKALKNNYSQLAIQRGQLQLQRQRLEQWQKLLLWGVLGIGKALMWLVVGMGAILTWVCSTLSSGFIWLGKQMDSTPFGNWIFWGILASAAWWGMLGMANIPTQVTCNSKTYQFCRFIRMKRGVERMKRGVERPESTQTTKKPKPKPKPKPKSTRRAIALVWLRR